MKGKFQGFENLYVQKTHFSKNFSLQNVVYGEKIKRALYTLHDEMHIIHIWHIHMLRYYNNDYIKPGIKMLNAIPVKSYFH